MGSPAVKSHKRASKSSSSPSSDKSGGANSNGNDSNDSRNDKLMTTSTLAESFVESKLLSWLRLFRFASLLSRHE